MKENNKYEQPTVNEMVDSVFRFLLKELPKNCEDINIDIKLKLARYKYFETIAEYKPGKLEE